MGLELVELVMEVEDEFRIRIPDEEAEKCINIAFLADYVCKAQLANGQTPDHEAVRRRIHELVEQIMGDDVCEVHDEANIVYDLGINARSDISRGVARRRRERPIRDVL